MGFKFLLGQKVVLVRTEGACLSGGLVRQRMKYMRFKTLRHLTQPAKGPFHFRSPSKMMWRTIRGMIPHKTKKGMLALGRVKCYEGIPPPYDKVKRLVDEPADALDWAVLSPPGWNLAPAQRAAARPWH